MKNQLSNGVFVFSSDSDILAKLKPGTGGLAPLFKAVDKFDRTGRSYYIPDPTKSKTETMIPAIGGVFVLQPFIWNQRAYISMSDLDQEWIIIAK